MENSSLKLKAAKGMVWSAVGTFSSQTIRFVIGIILARLLLPADYGLIGMLAFFFAISQIFIESGFSNGLIQKLDRSEIDYSTIFYFNLATSFLFYLILFFSAPLIAKFYNVPDLILITRVLALNFLVNSISLVQQARLAIQLDFKTPALSSLFSIIISGSLGIYMAFRGFGVWALVIQSLSASIIRSLLIIYFTRWVPKSGFSYSSFRQLFGFSSKLLAAGFIATIVNNLYSILIGKIFNAKDLGFYTRARQFPELLSNTITGIVQGVTYPILTSLQNDKQRLISVYGRLMRITVFIVMPSLTLFAILTEPFIRIFLTEKWMPIVPLIKWLCFARIITPISALNMNILNSIGRSDLYFRVDVSKLPLTLATLVITVPFGLKVVVIGHFLTSAICFFINAYYPGVLFGFGALRQIMEMKKIILSTIFMSVSVLGILQIIPEDISKLVIGLGFGIISYVLIALLLKIEEVSEIKNLTRQYFLNRRKGN